MLFVVQTGVGERDECGRGLQGLRTLLRSGILDIPSVTLSAGGQAFQTGRLESGNVGGRHVKKRTWSQTKGRRYNATQPMNRANGRCSLQRWEPAEIKGQMMLRSKPDTDVKMETLHRKAPS